MIYECGIFHFDIYLRASLHLKTERLKEGDSPGQPLVFARYEMVTTQHMPTPGDSYTPKGKYVGKTIYYSLHLPHTGIFLF